MTEPKDHPENAIEAAHATKAAKTAPLVSPEMLRTGGWVAAAGIGSAALVAALMYARKPGKKPE